MTHKAKPQQKGRKAFKGMASKGYAIRMMEPGEVPALLELEKVSLAETSTRAAHPPDIDTFTRFLLAHEVFVAIRKKSGKPVGFAAAVAESDLYWLSRFSVDPDHRDRELEDSLLKSVAERAHWFFYRALGLSIDSASSRAASFYEKRGFLRIPTSDLPQWLDEKRRAEASDHEANNQIVMLKWL
ncbi:hypothetical protein FP2506_14179 [Fulvimarina pelagi HTCC2506]|uniref:N-acetyltransferase domain-containing protein n=1 Tax=Fulvimarina pelagi HTCC2506 TaxID=314231 RepID=Q0G494_9HYPH|nr:GNAT family N-acetyltransferase [Fulvimarina pelagi]EAU41587.1 hypothetical protein FP2506_14179 [Fulvimarina pelagi HTCC2506]